jgi:type I restriction enzyme R subunit
MQKIFALHNWTPVQRKWLNHLAKQLKLEIVIATFYSYFVINSTTMH